MSINIGIQFFGGRGSGGGGSARRGGGGGGSNPVQQKMDSALQASPGMKEYQVTQVLENAPIGTKVFDGTTTITDTQSGVWSRETTFWEKTSQYGWTRFGDTSNYDPISSNKVAKTISKRQKVSVRP